VQIEGAEIGHRQAANELAEERVAVKDTAYPGDDDRCRGGDRQRRKSRGGHHNPQVVQLSTGILAAVKTRWGRPSA
jgi:hypothetical protein